MALLAQGTINNPANARYYITDNQSFTKELTQAFYGYVIRGNGTIELDTNSNYFGIKVKESNVKIKLTINGKEEIVSFNELYYIKLNSTDNHIKIESLDNALSIEAFIY